MLWNGLQDQHVKVAMAPECAVVNKENGSSLQHCSDEMPLHGIHDNKSRCLLEVQVVSLM